MKRFLLIICLICLLGCGNEDISYEQVQPIENELYFPAINSTDWETISPESLNWSSNAVNDLFDFLSQNNTRAFIVLKEGKIVIEKYWGNNILNSGSFNENSNWYWASAGKTLTAVLVGIAQQQQLINIHNKASDYLGINWSDLPLNKEDLITLKHQLTMTTGLDYEVPNPDCTEPECLQYKEDAGFQWHYHNAPYTLLESVISNAANMTYNEYTQMNIGSKIGINGSWIPSGNNNVYWSTARDAARFGLLLLSKGMWDNKLVLAASDYFEAMTNSSQNLNPSYGYLTWLNGKSSIILPGFSTSFNAPLAQDAPYDLFAALGKNGQFIDVVPSDNLVVIRMGEAPGNDLVPTIFHNDMWKKMNALKN